MKFIPILFSTPMVQAILEDSKTMTRRIAAVPVGDHFGTDIMDWGLSEHPHLKNGVWKYKVQTDVDDFETYTLKDKYGQPGDVLWVRERAFKNGDEWIYYADGTCCQQFEQCECSEVGKPKWKPSIHMPKEACRLFLEVIAVRVERLQDISPGDACDEGVEYWDVDAKLLGGGELVADFKNYMWRDDESYEDYHFPTYADPVSSFRSLWQKINGPTSWKTNPWVWVVSFKSIEMPDTFIMQT